MKKHFKMVCISLGALISVLVVIALITLSSRAPEPTYDGKPLHAWLRGFDSAQSSSEYAAAQEAIKQIGTNALPSLISYLRRKDPPFHRQWVNLKSRLFRGEWDEALYWRRRAAHACGALGPAGEPAFPALREAMNDPGAASDVGNSLSRMMPKSVPVLTNILATGNERARARAADNLITGFSHPEVEQMARTALLGALRDSDRGVRMSAASAFQFWNTNLDLIVPELTRTLGDTDPSVRGNAATTLGNFGVSASPAAPALVGLLQDTNSYVGGTVADRARQMLLK
ncbi:MAG: HEAT repeat domain-containing protein, partial [Candidatus Binatia bacterium]